MISQERKRLRREFWSRCRRIYERSGLEGVYYIRDGDATIRISPMAARNANSDIAYGVSVQMKRGGGVTHISERSTSHLSGYCEAVDAALPILRNHMILDDLADV